MDGTLLVLDEIAGLALLSAGVTPTQVDKTFDYTVSQSIFEQAGVTLGPEYGSGPNIERIAAYGPDQIAGISIPTTVEAEAALTAVAPVVILDFQATWEDQLAAIGTAFDRTAETSQIRARVAGEVEQLRADIEAAGKSGSTVSVIADNPDFFALDSAGAVGSLLTQLGLERPATQQAPTDPAAPFINFSAETLADHDADYLVVLAGGAYATADLESSPLWPTLTAVENETTTQTVAELWFSSSAFGLTWILDDLRALILDEGEPGTEADADARWSSYTNDIAS